jgi:hypothetical protein
MPTSVMRLRVRIVRTEVSEEFIASIFNVEIFRDREIALAVGQQTGPLYEKTLFVGLFC